MRIKGKFIILNLVLMLCFWGLASTSSKFYSSQIEEAKSELMSETASENSELDFSNMTLDEIAIQLDPDKESQNFIIVDSNQLKNSRSYKVIELESGYRVSDFNTVMYGRFSMFKIDGKYVFCIEPRNDIISVANKVSISQSKYDKYSASTKKYIEKVISSTIGKYNKTQNLDYIFSGQLLIWEYLSTSDPALANTWRIRNVEKYRSEIKEIEDDVKSWNKLPSFLNANSKSPKVHTLKYDIKTDTFSVILTDTNGVWDAKYANYSNFGAYTLTNPSGANNVKISIKSEQLKTSGSRASKWTPAVANTNIFFDASQDLIYVGSSPVTGYMAFKTEKKPQGGFKVTKVNSETNKLLAGAEYSLYSESGAFIKKYTTNKSGMIDSGLSLVPGKYNLVETKAPTGFVLDSTKQIITVTNGKVTDYASKAFKNDPIRGGFELTKVGVKLDGSKIPLANVEFTVTSKTYPEFKKVYKTNKNGVIKTTSSELLYGSYSIEETKVSNEYVANFKQDFEITNNGKIIKLNSSKQIENQLYVNKIEVTKVGQLFENDDINEYPLSGAKFKIYEEKNNVDGILDEDDELIEEITTNAKGKAISSYLPSGSYLIQESVAPLGYTLSDETHAFTINKKSGKPNQSTITLDPISNEVIKGKATLIKHGVRPCEEGVCQTPLNKVSFGIYKYNEDEVETNPIEIIETDDLGVATTNDLKFGRYYAKEISNEHPNYTMTDEIFEFEITIDNSIVEINEGNPIENDEKLGKVKIIKSGQSLQNGSEQIELLADAEYTIFDVDANPVDVLITDANGEAESLELSFGKYTIQETKAPSGYILDSSVYNFEIDENTYKEVLELKFADQVITNQIQITKVDADTKNALEGAKLEIRDRKSDEVIESWTSTYKPYVSNLKVGEYEICESSAPNGYIQKSTCDKFEVNDPDVTQIFEIENTAFSMTVTGSDIFSSIIKLIIVIAGLVLLKFVYKFKREIMN